MSGEIGVSICCTAYNHERYIRQCLDGFVNQRTAFPFEVIVHDDASTDATAQIIREYAEKYPHIIKPILQTENQYSQNVDVTADYIFPAMQGKYIAFCEGDDYWADLDKLQLQYDLMEANPLCAISVHPVLQIHAQTGDALGIWGARGESRVLSTEEFLQIYGNRSECPFHVSSYFIRREAYGVFMHERVSTKTRISFSDVPCQLWCALQGSVGYIDRVMSHYRVMAAGSWNTRNQNPGAKIKKDLENLRLIDYFNEYSGQKYAQLVQPRVFAAKADILARSKAASPLSQEARQVLAGLSGKEKTKMRVHTARNNTKVFLAAARRKLYGILGIGK